MTLPLFWRASARDDLAKVIGFIAEQNPDAARRIKALIEAGVHAASEHPSMFRRGRVAGTREIVAHPNYLVIYRVAAERIEIISILHARRQYP